MKHTPLPFKYEDTGLDSIEIIDADGFTFAEIDRLLDNNKNALERAKFIVTACNSYYALREALEEFLGYEPVFSFLQREGRMPPFKKNKNTFEKAHKALEQSKE